MHQNDSIASEHRLRGFAPLSVFRGNSLPSPVGLHAVPVIDGSYGDRRLPAGLRGAEFYEIRYIVDTLLIRKLLTHSLQIHYDNTEPA